MSNTLTLSQELKKNILRDWSIMTSIRNHLTSLNAGIINYSYDDSRDLLTLEFETEQDKMFFLLKYS